MFIVSILSYIKLYQYLHHLRIEHVNISVTHIQKAGLEFVTILLVLNYVTDIFILCKSFHGEDTIVTLWV